MNSYQFSTRQLQCLWSQHETAMKQSPQVLYGWHSHRRLFELPSRWQLFKRKVILIVNKSTSSQKLIVPDMPNVDSAAKVLRSTWIPAPPSLYELATVKVHGIWIGFELIISSDGYYDAQKSATAKTKNR